MSPQPSSAPLQVIDLASLARLAQTSGPQWGTASEDLNLTLLSWPRGQGVKPHVNHEVDVVLVVIAGQGEVTVDGQHHELRSGQSLLISKGHERGILAVSERFSYLSVHRRRRGLMPTLQGQPVL